MRRNALAVVMLFLGVIAFAMPAGAWVYVPSYGDTGWQNYSYQAGASGFTGTAGFVVSDQGDTIVEAQLLLDNLTGGGVVNGGFELGDYTGYTLGPGSNGSVITGPVTANSGNVYNPTGTYMSFQWSNADDTSGFLNAYGHPGTDGSILETEIALAAGESFTFNWAFLETDYTPFEDFSLFYLKDVAGAIAFTDGLGQLGPGGPPIPEPATMLLLGSGLLGLAGYGRKKLFKN